MGFKRHDETLNKIMISINHIYVSVNVDKLEKS